MQCQAVLQSQPSIRNISQLQESVLREIQTGDAVEPLQQRTRDVLVSWWGVWQLTQLLHHQRICSRVHETVAPCQQTPCGVHTRFEVAAAVVHVWCLGVWRPLLIIICLLFCVCCAPTPPWVCAPPTATTGHVVCEQEAP